MNKRILLLYISPDSGHHKASLAIEKALYQLHPQCDILNINALHYINPVLERIIKKSYFGLIRTSPEVWDYLYDNPRVIQGTQRLCQFIQRFHSPKFEALLETFQPDVIACTQAFPCGLVADVKKSRSLSTPLAAILTDYLPHSYWYDETVDFYIVPSEKAKTKLSENGIPKEKIFLFGIPIDPKFSLNGKVEKMRPSGLDPDVPVVLLMGGSHGLGPISQVVRKLDRSDLSLQMLVVCGNNRRLFERLKRREKRFKKKVFVFGFVEYIDRLMEAATLLVTKPGGVTTAEALAKDLPLVLLDPIRGQETSNANFLVEEKVALQAEDADELVVLVEELLSRPAILKAMRLRAQNRKRPKSALEIAKFLLSV